MFTFMKLVEIVTYPDLEWDILVCGCPCAACKRPVALVGKAGSEVSRDPIFSWAVLAAVTLVRGGPAMEGLAPRPGPGWLLPSSAPATSLSGCQQSSSCWGRSPEGRVQAGSSSVCAPSPECSPSVLAGSRSGARDARSGASCRPEQLRETNQTPHTVFSLLPPLLAESRQTRAPVLREQSLGLLSPPVSPTVFTS